jgi:hypothetical protein
VNTSAGDPIAIAGVASGDNPAVFNFVPGGVSPSHKTTIPTGVPGSFNTIYNTGPGSNNAIVAASTGNNGPANGSGAGAAVQAQHTNWWLAASGACLFFIYLAGERLVNFARRPGSLTSAMASLKHFLF